MYIAGGIYYILPAILKTKTMKEIWKNIDGYDGVYQVSNLGRVRSVDRVNYRGYRLKGKLLALCKNNTGYYMVRLYNEGVGKTEKVHRLVAIAFISNPDNLNVVNHIDHNPVNNRCDNLEWCTQDENIQAANDHGCYDHFKKPVFQIDAESGKVIKKFKSIANACRELGAHSGGIIGACKGRIVTHMGYLWSYTGSDIDKKMKRFNGRQCNGFKKRVKQICLSSGRVIGIYLSMSDAQKQNKSERVTTKGVSDCCNGKLMTHAGYRWEYA